jgi:ubiquinone/menaquinone biosynthesis C-methylase UbiE
MWFRIKQIAKRFTLVQKIITMIPVGWRYTLGSTSERSAMAMTINTTSPDLYDKQGMQLAEELKARMPADSVVLDFGCGLGRPEKFLWSYCREIYCVDVSVGILRLARKRYKNIHNVHFLKSRKTDLSILRDCTFDFIFSEAVFQHIDKEHVILILKELYRVCKKDGRVYLQFCNLLCPANLDVYFKSAKRFLDPHRMRSWLIQEVQTVMKEIGFNIISLELKSDSRDENRDFQLDDYHRDYNIWVLASKK